MDRREKWIKILAEEIEIGCERLEEKIREEIESISITRMIHTGSKPVEYAAKVNLKGE